MKLHEGPWFVIGIFLSVKIWKQNLFPKNLPQHRTRLSQLPIEFYDRKNLEKWERSRRISSKSIPILRILYGGVMREYVFKYHLTHQLNNQSLLGTMFKRWCTEGKEPCVRDVGESVIFSNFFSIPSQATNPRNTTSTSKEETKGGSIDGVWKIVIFPKKHSKTKVNFQQSSANEKSESNTPT